MLATVIILCIAIAEPLPEIPGSTSFYKLKEGSNCNTMCMERKSCSARITTAQDGKTSPPPHL